MEASKIFGSWSKGTCANAGPDSAHIAKAAAKIVTIHLISFISLSPLSINHYDLRKGTSSGCEMVRLICNTSAFCGEPRALSGGLKRGTRACGLEYPLC